MCENSNGIAVEAALEVFARLIEMLTEGGIIGADEALELAEIAKRYERE